MDAGRSFVPAITGPTGCGKTELTLALAEKIPLEIVSCDSRKVFRGADIGAAKPTAEQQERVPFHLLDLVDPVESFSVQQYVAAALPVIADIRARGKLPLIEGGTGLYLEALKRGYDFGGAPPVPELRDALAKLWERDQEALVSALEKLFPGAADKVDLHNHRRVVRLVERKVVVQLSQDKAEQTLDELGLGEAVKAVKSARREAQSRASSARPVNVRGYTLEVEREVLAERIARRTDDMLASGLIEEVKQLLGADVPREAQVFSGIGYSEVLLYLDGDASLKELAELIAAHTRQFARRQDTWNRNRFGGFRRIPYTTREERAAALGLLTDELSALRSA
jgi:tRNA dimethylallyltransferase